MKGCLRDWIVAGCVAVAVVEPSALAFAQESIAPPAVPPAIQVQEGNTTFLRAHALGTQNYTCAPAAAGYAWKAAAPEATLFANMNWMNSELPQQIVTHFLSPNPSENGMPRLTWQSSIDTSRLWGNPIASSSDPGFVAPGALSWLLLQVVGSQPAPAAMSPTNQISLWRIHAGGASLAGATYIQRVNTSGGAAPADACSGTENLAVTKFVPYSADYVFYRAAK